MKSQEAKQVRSFLICTPH